MSEILTAAQVAEKSLFEAWRNRAGDGNCGSMDYARMAFEYAYSQGAKLSAQRVATLMDEADQAQVEIERLKEDNWRLEKERNIAQVLRNDTWVELAALRARIAELEKERDAARSDRDGYRALLTNRKEFDAAIAERDAATTRAEVAESQRDEFAANVTRVRVQRDGLRRAIESAPVLLREAAVFIERVSVTAAVSVKESDRLQRAGDKIRKVEEMLSRILAAVPAPAPQLEDLCPFHDLGHEFSKCTCPMDHPNRVNAESPLISTLRELIATTLDEADLKRQIVNAVEGSNMTINTPAPRPLTEAELKRWSRDRCEGLGDQSGRMENL